MPTASVLSASLAIFGAPIVVQLLQPSSEPYNAGQLLNGWLQWQHSHLPMKKLIYPVTKQRQLFLWQGKIPAQIHNRVCCRTLVPIRIKM
jgi:hypothetical protein